MTIALMDTRLTSDATAYPFEPGAADSRTGLIETIQNCLKFTGNPL